MVDLCPVVKWWSENRTEKKPVCGSKCLLFKWSAKSSDFTIRILDTHTVQYLDLSSIQVVDVEMVAVNCALILICANAKNYNKCSKKPFTKLDLNPKTKVKISEPNLSSQNQNKTRKPKQNFQNQSPLKKIVNFCFGLVKNLLATLMFIVRFWNGKKWHLLWPFWNLGVFRWGKKRVWRWNSSVFEMFDFYCIRIILIC